MENNFSLGTQYSWVLHGKSSSRSQQILVENFKEIRNKMGGGDEDEEAIPVSILL